MTSNEDYRNIVKETGGVRKTNIINYQASEIERYEDCLK